MPKDNSIHSSSSGLSALWRANSREEVAFPYSAHFESGKTYTYSVHTWTAALTSFLTESQSQDDTAQYQQKGERLAEVKATAWITALSECEVSMQLKNVQILNAQEEQLNEFEREEKSAFIRQLQTPILFGYSHGVVTEVCTDVQEDEIEAAALNLKKSIISALQTIPQLADSNAYPIKVRPLLDLTF